MFAIYGKQVAEPRRWRTVVHNTAKLVNVKRKLAIIIFFVGNTVIIYFILVHCNVLQR